MSLAPVVDAVGDAAGLTPAYDLHSHSLASDGTLRPAALVARAKRRRLDGLALTDHDTTAGIAAAQQAAGEQGVRLIPGVEISVTWAHSTVHILGLNIDPACDRLQAGLAALRAERDRRARLIAQSLAALGVADALARAAALGDGELVSRTHFARILAQDGLVEHPGQAFQRYLGPGKPAYVEGRWAALDEAVDWITAAGGVAAIAHPGRYRFSNTRLKRLMEAFTAAGGRALEVVSGRHTADQVAWFGGCARRFGLLVSRGSDFHGPEFRGPDLNAIPALPPGLTPVWSVWDDV